MGNAYSIYRFLFSGLYNLQFLVIYYAIFCLIALWAIFEKAFEPGWGAIIPIYNFYLYYKITWGNGWLFLLLLIPYANILVAIITTFKLARSFGMSFWFGAGLIFLNPIFMGILAFGKPRYVGVPEKGSTFSL